MVPSKLASVLLAIALPAGAAGLVDDRLAAANYRAVGDALVDMLNATGITLAAMTLGLETPVEGSLHAAVLTPGGRRRSEQAACRDGGRLTVTTLDADGSDDLSRGDQVEIRFDRCAVQGKVVSGSSRFEVTGLRDEAGREVTELEFEFRELGTTDLRWSGHAHMQLATVLSSGAEHELVRYRDLQVHLHGQSMRWDFALDVQRPPIGGQVASFDGPLRIGPLALQLRQDEPFAIDERGWPRAGQLAAIDAAGARLEVRAEPEGYAYRFSAATERAP